MRQLKLTLLGGFLLVLAGGLCGTMTGCSDDSSGTSQATVSEQAKKVDQGGQAAMKDFMQGKGKTPASAKK